MEKEKLLTPTEYFEQLKEKKKGITNKDLEKIYKNCMQLLNKYIITGQVAGARKLMFHLETIEKEKDIVALGIDTFVYKDDIEDFIEHVASKVVKIIELERYEREIPDEIVNLIAKVKDKFDVFYIVFTDYTGKVEKQVQQERRDKDPILFGTFQNKTGRTIVDRFYYIGDWEDEYCDLTLDKMVNETKHKNGQDIIRYISTPLSLTELKEQVSNLKESGRGDFLVMPGKPKQNFFSKIKTFIGK